MTVEQVEEAKNASPQIMIAETPSPLHEAETKQPVTADDSLIIAIVNDSAVQGPIGRGNKTDAKA